jgi:hypothetical protein
MEEVILKNISLSLVVGILIKICLGIMTLLALVTVRQASLMDKVVDVPIGNWFKVTAWGFFWLSLIITISVVLIV